MTCCDFSFCYASEEFKLVNIFQLDFLDGGSGMPRISSLPTVIECAACANAEADLRHTRSVIASLHEKLQTLEIDHANAKREYEEVALVIFVFALNSACICLFFSQVKFLQ